MPVSPDNFKDVEFVLAYVGTVSNRNELNDKLRDDNVTVDSLAVIMLLANELRKVRGMEDSAKAAQESAQNAVDEAQTEREVKAENQSAANAISSGGQFGQ
jgi:glutamine phosphoribosylpyrophosphate amidotransferase